MTTDQVWELVREERYLQKRVFPRMGRENAEWLTLLAEEMGEAAKAMLEDEGPERLRDEVVQIAALAVAWIEDRG